MRQFSRIRLANVAVAFAVLLIACIATMGHELLRKGGNEIPCAQTRSTP